MIFVTGGTGLVGSHILLKLSQRGEELKALKRATSSMEFSHYSEAPKSISEEVIAKVKGTVYA